MNDESTSAIIIISFVAYCLIMAARGWWVQRQDRKHNWKLVGECGDIKGADYFYECTRCEAKKTVTV